MDKVFRQTSSKLATAMNKIRIGIYDQSVADTLKPSIRAGSMSTDDVANGTLDAKTDGSELKIEATMLHSHNAVVDRVNQCRLRLIKDKEVMYQVSCLSLTSCTCQLVSACLADHWMCIHIRAIPTDARSKNSIAIPKNSTCQLCDAISEANAN